LKYAAFKNKIYSLILISLCLIININSQTIVPKYIGIGDGLASGYVMSILQDSYGLLWIGTDNGLHIYDGYKFVRYKNIPLKNSSLQNNTVWGLAEDDDKNIWVSTDIGVSKYVRKTNSFTNYDFNKEFNLNSNQGGRVFNLFEDSKERLWASSQLLGLLLYDKTIDKWNQIKCRIKDSVRVPNAIFMSGVIEDRDGKIWAGSGEFGLIYLEPNDSIFKSIDQANIKDNVDFSTSENTITGLYADPTNVIWITARNGVYKYFPRKNLIKTIKTYSQKKTQLYNHWNKIFQDDKGNVWMANNFRGILKFDGISDEFVQVGIKGRSTFNDGTQDITLTDAIIDNTGIFWIGTTSQGLIKFDPNNEPFIQFTHEKEDKNSVSSNQIFSLIESKIDKGKIFVGTAGGYLNLFDEATKKFNQIKFKSVNDMYGGSVRGIAEEDDGSLLLGTWGDGIIEMNSKFQEINRFSNDSLSFNSLSNDLVRVIKKDVDGTYWIGTNSGLNKLNLKTKKIKRVTSEVTKVYPQELIDETLKLVNRNNSKAKIIKVGDNQNLIEEFEVIRPREYLVVSAGEGFVGDTLLYDYGFIVNAKQDTIWGGRDATKTLICGGAIKNRLRINLIELKPGKYTLHYISDDSHSYGNWNANPPTYPQFWGINVIELENKNLISKIENYLNQRNQEIFIKGNNIRDIQISNNIIWIGTDQQDLTKIDRQKKKKKNYQHDEKKSNSISNNTVQSIYEDKNGILWLATDTGLNKFDSQKEKFTVYTEEDGLPTNYISSILPGNNGELWISTRSGISKMVFDKETGKVTFVNYDTEDGIKGMNFTALVALKSSSGNYYFGSNDGLSVFTPKESNIKPPQLVFEDLKISNKSVKTYKNDENPIETSVEELKNLTLPYNQNDLTFVFASLSYSNPSKNQYAHKLAGYDKEWLYDNKREVSYTNLDPGEYTFSIKGSNRDGVWSTKAKSIKIAINPPWWYTTWAYIGYGLILIAGVFGIDRIQRKRLLSKERAASAIKEAELRAAAAEAQSKAMQAENDRKTKELEEARELQLSMLPKELPNLPHLDIAVYMKTATEVGGDYYDFHIGMDGRLTVVLGDATGHGMKAGTMVTTTKSLFNVLAPNPNIIDTFHEMTRCLKLMHLEKLSMCMSMLKIMGNKLQMSSAGMPPIFIYKRESQVTEEHVIKGMPLGTFNEFPYNLVESEITTGDTILLMSDGFPELVNENDEILGYKRVRNLFEEVAGLTPEEIINKLKNAGSNWTHDKDPDDDVTFVVIKMK